MLRHLLIRVERMAEHDATAKPEQVFLAQLPLIERVARHTCRRHHLSVQDAEEFESALKLKLIADDYGVIRKFQGRSSLSTFLTAVIQHFFLDYLDHLWGRWRPSAQARRLGPVAVELERMLTAEDLPLGEACELLRTNRRIGMSTEELEALAARLPARTGRHFASEDVLAGLASPTDHADDLIERSERDRLRSRIETALAHAMTELSGEDRLILRMNVQEGRTVAAIARALGREPKGLYRRLEQVRRDLRDALVRQGVRPADVDELLENPAPRPGRPILHTSPSNGV
jgi:RNA polymerase sigma factor (sigma-70 family)